MRRTVLCLHFGRSGSSPYPRWDGPATVVNVRAAVRKMVEEAGRPEDRIAFVTSSHGCGDGVGNSYLCLLPDPVKGGTPSEKAGQYWDHGPVGVFVWERTPAGAPELAADLGGAGRNQAHNVVFIDAARAPSLLPHRKKKEGMGPGGRASAAA